MTIKKSKKGSQEKTRILNLKTASSESVMTRNKKNKMEKYKEALLESEENYKELANSIKDVFFAMDNNFRHTYWNKAYEELTGISSKKGLGKSIYEIFPSFKGSDADRVFKEVLKTQVPQSFINRRFVKGKELFFEGNVYPSKNGLSVFVKDITKIKEKEKELEESENRLRMAMNAANMISWDRNFKTDEFIFSENFSKYFNLSEDYDYKNPDNAILAVYPDDRNMVLDVCKKALGKGGIFEVEFRGNPKNGKTEWFLAKGLVSFDKNGNPERINGVTMNITKRKEAEEKLNNTMNRLELLSRSLIGIQETERKRIARELHDEIGQSLTAIKINLQASQHDLPPISRAHS